MSSHYLVLNVSRRSTKKEVKAAYRLLAKKYHPDVNPTRAAGAMFTKVQSAYDTLSNDVKRRAYDRELRERGSTTTAGTSDTGTGRSSAGWAQNSSAWKGKYDERGQDDKFTAAANPNDYLGARRNINEEFIERLRRKEKFYEAYGDGKY